MPPGGCGWHRLSGTSAKRCAGRDPATPARPSAYTRPHRRHTAGPAVALGVVADGQPAVRSVENKTRGVSFSARRKRGYHATTDESENAPCFCVASVKDEGEGSIRDTLEVRGSSPVSPTAVSPAEKHSAPMGSAARRGSSTGTHDTFRGHFPSLLQGHGLRDQTAILTEGTATTPCRPFDALKPHGTCT